MRHALERLVYGRLRDRLNRDLLEWILARTGAITRALEAGSGTASGSVYLSEKLPLAAALDFDISALARARHQLARLPVIQDDLYRLPIKGGSIDLVWSNSTFEELPHPKLALGEMIRALRTGGMLFIGVPNRHGPLGFEPLFKGTKLGNWIGSTWRSSDLGELLKKHGLTAMPGV